MRFAAIVTCALLAACGPIEVRPDVGRAFTIQHGTARFQDAMQGAQTHCSRDYGMAARHLGTDRGGELLLSRFECVAQ